MISKLDADLAIIGGGLGGVSAALSALRAGRRVVMTEQYAWLGGQLTSQAVPPDEHSWVEQFGVTRSYRELRDAIRDHYRRWYPLTDRARLLPDLNPGAGLVSRLCAEPGVAAAVIDAMLRPYVSSGALTLLQPYVPVGAEVDGESVRSVTVEAVGGGGVVVITARYVVDATETGELLPLVGAEYVVGSESRAQTGEPSAPELADPGNVQAFSWCFAIDNAGSGEGIPRPADYDYWRAYEPEFWGAPMLSLTAPHPRTLETVTRTFNPDIDDDPFESVADQRVGGGDDELWTFRRILARKLMRPGFLASDIVLVNWPMIDYLGGSIIDTPDADEHLRRARALSYSFFYWLHTEAPRPDGGKGWPNLRLRGDVTGSRDGLAQAPYIRESRRIVAEYTVRENDLSIAVRGTGAPARYSDSVGVGMYRIDLHPSTGGDNYLDIASSPFEIPLGALIPVRLQNLLPAGKNIGTTHITNGAFRLHPVEWNIGEAVGALASFCIERRTSPREVRNTPRLLEELQSQLARNGVELHWPDVTGY
jgi:hypothetical protein